MNSDMTIADIVKKSGQTQAQIHETQYITWFLVVLNLSVFRQ